MSINRMKKVQTTLSKWGVDAFVVTDPIDLYYLSGIKLSLGTIVVSKNKTALIVDSRYFEKCQKEASLPVLLAGPGVVGKELSGYSSVGFASENLTYSAYLKLQAEVSGTLVALEYPMQQIRAIKEASEVAALEKAISLCYKGFDFVISRLHEGVTEESVAKDLQIYWLTHGADGLSFDSIIAFGKNSSMPHYRAGSTTLKAHDIVLVDIGVVVDGYASDMTRTFFFGKPDARLEEIYDIVLAAQEQSIESVRPEISCAELYEVSKKAIEKAGYGDKYLHGLGHGIGLETHEYPALKSVSQSISLQPGMCVTIEPGIYLPELGGVRIEDMVLVTAEGHRNLTSGYPKCKLII